MLVPQLYQRQCQQWIFVAHSRWAFNALYT